MDSEEQVATGRSIVSGVIASYATMVLFTIVYGGQKFDSTLRIVTFAIQTTLTALILWGIWSGRRWVKWLFSALCILALGFLVWGAIENPSLQMALLVGYFFALLAALCGPSAVDDFMADQKKKRAGQPAQTR